MPRGGSAGAEGAIKAAVNETLTQASNWFADEADAPVEQSAAFEDNVICGMGWTEPRVVYDNQDFPEGVYEEPQIDPTEMYWDCFAKGRNLKDARRIARARKVSLDDAMAKFPGYSPVDLNAGWADIDEIEIGKSVEERRRKQDTGWDAYDDLHKEVVI